MRLNSAISVILALSMIATPLSVIVGVAAASENTLNSSFGGGSGTVGDPFIIENIWELQNMSNDLGAYYVLGNDIDASVTASWNWSVDHFEGFFPIGDSVSAFTGDFNGNNYTIYNLYVNRPMETLQGLFGYIEAAGTIRFANLVNISVTGSGNIGGLVGRNYGDITHSSTAGQVLGELRVGGLAGRNYGLISKSYSEAKVEAADSATGGLVGRQYAAGNIEYSYSTGNVNAANQNAGGLVGYNEGDIAYSYSNSNVAASDYVGGFVGNVATGTIQDCYSSGKVTGTVDFGGFSGLYQSGTVNNCFYDNDTSNQNTDASGASGLNTTDFRNITKFTDAGWDYSTIWYQVNNNTRPFLKSEFSLSIRNSHQLHLIALDLDGDYHLACDFNASETENLKSIWASKWYVDGNGFIPVGNISASFNGTFDGQNHTISSMFIHEAGVKNKAIFAVASENASVSNLRMYDFFVYSGKSSGHLIGTNYGNVSNCHTYAGWKSGNDVCGGLVGVNDGGKIANCSSNTEMLGSWYTGGLVGRNIDGIIENCSSSGVINGASYSGGLVGHSQGSLSVIKDCFTDGSRIAGHEKLGGLIGLCSDTTVERCYSTKKVVADYTSSDVGGLIGRIDGTSTVTHCAAYGKVKGLQFVGGFVGILSTNGKINDCYSTGEVEGNSRVGGFAGARSGGSIISSYSIGLLNAGSDVTNGGFLGEAWDASAGFTDCYWDTDSSNSTALGNTQSTEIFGKTTAEMKTESTFVTWDFANTWYITENVEYPELRWLMGEKSFSGGAGTVADPFIIENVWELQNISVDLSANYSLANDIDASITSAWNSGAGFAPIGSEATQFTGNLDGQHYDIINLNINRPLEDVVGIFRYTGIASSIINVTIIECSITGGSLVGCLVAESDGTIENCSSSGTVSGDDAVGGLIFRNAGLAKYCFSTCDVISAGNTAGGFAALNWGSDGSFSPRLGTGTIENCYSTGSVSGNVNIGGFCGVVVTHGLSSIINNCYSSGSVTGNTTGGFNGGYWDTDKWSQVTDCFWDTETSGQATSANGTGKTTSEMLDNTTYKTAGWDFDNVWFSTNSWTRPFLRWEYSTEIETPHQLQLMDMDKTADYVLACDLDMSEILDPSQMWGTSPVSGKGFHLIGSQFIESFTGTFDGGHHTISSLYINGAVECALFGDMQGKVENLNIDNCNITSTMLYTASIAGINYGTIANCSSTGMISSSGDDVGGIVGRNYGIITNCYSNCQVTGSGMVGGLVGQNYDSIVNCYATGDVIGTDWETGGFIGRNYDIIMNCSSTGNVNGSNDVGGFVGRTEGSIINCSSTGDAVGTGDYVGGFAGYAFESISESSSIGNATGTDYVGGFVGDYASISEMITNCSSTGNANGINNVGGFVGNNKGDIARCYSKGDATGTGDSVGGFVGNNTFIIIPPMEDGSVTDCYAWGNTSGDNNVGGFVGFNDLNADITNAYSIGAVTGNTNVGGFCGINPSGTVTDCFWDFQTSGISSIVAGTPKTTSEMTRGVTFTDAGWDFTTIWGIYDYNSYPFLQAVNPLSPPVVDLEITLADSVDPVVLGDVLMYTVYFENHGPDNALDTYLNITLPVGVTFLNSSEPMPVNGRYMEGNIGVFGAGAFFTLFINVSVDSYGSGTLDCVAYITTSTYDAGVYANNTNELTDINRAPVAANDSWQTNEDWIFTYISPMSIMGNDNDPDSDPITVISHEDSDYGANITIYSDGGLIYNPLNSTTLQALHNGESLNDTFNYTIEDGRGGFATALITILVEGTDAPPTANNDTFVMAEKDGSYSLDVLANDVVDEEGDSFNISNAYDATNGTLTISADGLSLTYTPYNSNYSGHELLTYRIVDVNGVADMASIDLTITPVNDAPMAQGGMYFVEEDSGATTLDVLATDIDAEGDDLTITVVTQPDNGVVTITGSGKNLTYDPDANFFGDDFFNYTISDGALTATAMVRIQVNATNDAPVIGTTTLDDGDVGVAYSFVLNATDIDSTSLSWGGSSDATWLSIGASGTITGTPAAAGNYTVHLILNDGDGGIVHANLTLRVTGSGDTPVDPTTDIDGDGIPDITDTDDDGDGVPDTEDAFPLDETESVDTDMDGIGNNADTDDDGDGIPDDEDDTPLEPNDLGEDDQGPDYTWLYIIIILVIAGIVGAVLMLRPRGPKPEPEAPVQEAPEDTSDMPEPEEAPSDMPQPDEAEPVIEE